MSAIPYGLGVVTPAAGAGAAYAQLSNGTSGGNRYPIAVTFVGVTLRAATASSIGLILAATQGTPSTSSPGVSEVPLSAAGASVSRVNTAWSVAPTVGSVFLRQIVLPATAGTSFAWEWTEENPLIIDPAAAASLLIWNFGVGAGSILDVNLRWFESERYCQLRQKYSNDPDWAETF